jgi:hypothetical protein
MHNICTLQTPIIPEVLDGWPQVFFRNITIPIGNFITEKHDVSNPLLVRLSRTPDQLLNTPIRALVVKKAKLVEEQR